MGELVLPAPGTMVPLSAPLVVAKLKGIKVHPENPFQFDFILDRGQDTSSDEVLKNTTTDLIKYFLASITTPEKDLWVNLSPYEKERIVPESFGKTTMGRDLLALDYLLKQITASLIYPEKEVGKKFWNRVYEEAGKRFGTANVPINTFNKVWIVPNKAVVYENAKAGTAYIVEANLKVMLEADYLALDKNNQTANEKQTISSQIVREVVVPILTEEVNHGANFTKMRQVYYAYILAAWYKKKIKDSILNNVYGDQNKVAGVSIDNPNQKQEIYDRYLQAFKKGVYSYIKDDVDFQTKKMIPKKYFSGGMKFDSAMITYTSGAIDTTALYKSTKPFSVKASLRNVEDRQRLIDLKDKLKVKLGDKLVGSIGYKKNSRNISTNINSFDFKDSAVDDKEKVTANLNYSINQNGELLVWIDGWLDARLGKSAQEVILALEQTANEVGIDSIIPIVNLPDDIVAYLAFRKLKYTIEGRETKPELVDILTRLSAPEGKDIWKAVQDIKLKYPNWGEFSYKMYKDSKKNEIQIDLDLDLLEERVDAQESVRGSLEGNYVKDAYVSPPLVNIKDSIVYGLNKDGFTWEVEPWTIKGSILKIETNSNGKSFRVEMDDQGSNRPIKIGYLYYLATKGEKHEDIILSDGYVAASQSDANRDYEPEETLESYITLEKIFRDALGHFTFGEMSHENLSSNTYQTILEGPKVRDQIFNHPGILGHDLYLEMFNDSRMKYHYMLTDATFERKKIPVAERDKFLTSKFMTVLVQASRGVPNGVIREIILDLERRNELTLYKLLDQLWNTQIWNDKKVRPYTPAQNEASEEDFTRKSKEIIGSILKSALDGGRSGLMLEVALTRGGLQNILPYSLLGFKFKKSEVDELIEVLRFISQETNGFRNNFVETSWKLSRSRLFDHVFLKMYMTPGEDKDEYLTRKELAEYIKGKAIFNKGVSANTELLRMNAAMTTATVKNKFDTLAKTSPKELIQWLTDNVVTSDIKITVADDKSSYIMRFKPIKGRTFDVSISESEFLSFNLNGAESPTFRAVSKLIINRNVSYEIAKAQAMVLFKQADHFADIAIANVRRMHQVASNSLNLKNASSAMISRPTGGIDLKSERLDLKVQNQDGAINFNISPEMLAQLRNAAGFEPVVLDMKPIRDVNGLKLFLGVISK